MLVPVSAGEVVDKITILEIKSEKISDKQKLKNIHTELTELHKIWDNQVSSDSTLAAMISELKKVNLLLWDIEDQIRIKESMKAFDQEFIELARSVYVTNDKRAALKRDINMQLGSNLIEEKSYQDY